MKKLLWFAFYSLPLIAFAANFTEPRAEVVSAPTTQNRLMPVKVIILKSHRTLLSDPSVISSRPATLPFGKPTPLQVKAYIRTEAREHGVSPLLALWIVKHESQFNPRAKGDGEASRGLWQISKIYHPEVSDEVRSASRRAPRGAWIESEREKPVSGRRTDFAETCTQIVLFSARSTTSSILKLGGRT